MRIETAILAAASVAWAGLTQAAPRTIDTQKSTLTIRVGKAGAFSAFGHNHEIRAAIAAGTVETGEHPSVELGVNSGALRVADADVSEKDRGEIQRTMLGSEVLDSERYPEIVFRSTAAELHGPDHWTLYGNLTLHGETHPVSVDVILKAGHYTGYATLKWTVFGIKPVRTAGGAVKVRDEIQVEFDVVLMS
jgi:polyisoprenoid-binding protein YceI